MEGSIGAKGCLLDYMPSESLDLKRRARGTHLLEQVQSFSRTRHLLLAMTEQMMAKLMKEVRGIEITVPFARLTYDEALNATVTRVERVSNCTKRGLM